MKQISLLAIVLFSISCSEDETVKTNTIEYFEQHLNKDMSYRVLVRSFGEPVKDIGSGIHIYVYVLDDSTEVRIGFTDRMLYANHLDKDQRLLKELI